MRNTLAVFVLLLALLGLAACGEAPPLDPSETAPAETGEVIVFAAASLTEAFTELGGLFEAAHPGSSVIFNFAGSQQLAQQLGEGAPADLFASANARQMEVAIEAGRVLTETQQSFVQNRLVVIYPSDNPAGLSSLEGLAAPGVKLVLAAAEVPVGEYALAFLDRAGQEGALGAEFKAGALANVVSYEENVRAVLSKVLLGEADAGIVYASDISPANAAEVGRLDIPEAWNTIASYPVAPVSDAAHPALAQRFIELLLSAEGQALLARYGFDPINQ